MKKIILSFVGVCALFICICSLLITESYNLGSHKMATDTDYINTASISKDNAYDMSGDSAILIESTGIYSTQDTIILTFKTNTISKIVSYSIDSEGFKVLNHYKSGFEIFVKVKLYKEIEHPFVKVKINLQNGNSPEPVAYGYYKNGMVSINPYSYIDAMEEMNDYQLKNNLINKQEYEGASTELNSLPLQESVNSISRSEISLLSTNATVKGKVSWIGDDSKSHPLLFALVELYKIDSVTPLMSTYTDVAGNYSFSYSLSSGQEITPYVRIYPAGENVKVLKNDGSQYVWQSSSGTELTAGSSIEFNATFNMNSNLGRAFQISQPAIMASRFVKAMSGSNIATVSVCYPYSSDGCFYRRSTKTIYVTGNARASTNVPHSYASWDTIMHEYGHHVSYEFDIINSCGGTHWLGLDMANHYRSHLEGDNANTSCSCSYAAMNMNTAEDCKYWANRLAWSEGWASVFGTVVQQYYSSSLSNIATVGDTSYTSYNGVNYDLEKPSYINGESCELTVQAALWDMFDSVAETHDTLSLGYNSFWNMTTGSKAKSYEEFMNYFNENINNVSHISAAGKINTYYKMSPNNARLSSGTISTTAPVITWDNMSFGSKYYNTATYTVKFLDGVGTVLNSSGALSTNTYQVSQSVWNSVLSKSNKIVIAVFGGDNCSKSGLYCSELLVLDNPNNNLVHTNSTRVIERSITLAAGEYVDFYITFDGATMYDRVFTTFGSLDTVLTLYDENGSQISYDDDDGYGRNALIQLDQKNGTKYKLRVKFFSSSTSGTFRLVIFRAWRMNGKEPDKFENFFTSSAYTTIISTLGVGEDSSHIIKPTTSGNYIIETQTRIADVQDMVIYFFNPRTGEMYYDDDSAGNRQAKITVYLEANQEYFLIVTRFNPGATVTGESMTSIRPA